MSHGTSHRWLFEEPFAALTAQRLFEHKGAWQAGRIYKRREIADVLLDIYRQEGGVDKGLTRGRVIRTIKKKLPGVDEKNAWFEKIDFGHYRYCYASDDMHSSPPGASENGKDNDFGKLDNQLVPDREYGEGACEVYVWCLPHYENSGQRWPMKIGSAGEGGFNRRLEDFQENLPEVPRYLIRVRYSTEAKARKLERALHYYFENRGRRIERIPGTEWFDANPKEVVDAIGVLDPNLIAE